MECDIAPSKSTRARPGDDLAAVLRDIADRLASIERILANHGTTARRPLAAADLRALQLVLPAVADGLGHRGRIATAGELLGDLADRHPRRLKDLQRLLGDEPSKRLGKLLARAHGHVVDGLRVERCGSERGRALWRVLAADGF